MFPTTDSRPACTVVIPVRNSGRTIGACLRALVAQTGGDTEIIVVDDGSSDDTSAVSSRLGVTVLSQFKLGPAAARNRGAALASGDIILFTDADCVPASDWVHQMLRPFQEASVVGVRGAYTSSQASATARFVQLDYADRYRRLSTKRADGSREYEWRSIDFIDTYAAGYRRSELLEAGGFDESYARPSVEDQELSFRLAAAGQRLVFAPNATVAHSHPTTIRLYVRKKFKIGYYKPRVHRRHRSRILSDSHTPPVLRVQTVAACACLAFSGPALVSRWCRWVWAMAYAGILVTSFPLSSRNAKSDRAVAILTPGFVAVRAAALGAGWSLGVSVLVLKELLGVARNMRGTRGPEVRRGMTSK